ncbi:MAG: thiol:disulfide interchange protein, partial [Planctomyces sp.]
MTEASQKQQLLFLDITGINCVNCRLMEKTVLARKDVQNRLAGMVLSQLYLDSVPGISDTKLQEELLTHNRNLAAELLQDVTMPSYAVVA